MNNHTPAHDTALESAHDLYRHLALTPSLKGLLKPFKGKGDYQELGSLARETQHKLLIMMKHLVTLTECHQIAHHRMTLRLHQANSGQNYLRWRTFHNTAKTPSGDLLWEHVVSNPLTSPQTRLNLLTLERQRIALNAQASSVQSMIRQATQGLEKTQRAEGLIASLNSPNTGARHGDSIQR